MEVYRDHFAVDGYPESDVEAKLTYMSSRSGNPITVPFRVDILTIDDTHIKAHGHDLKNDRKILVDNSEPSSHEVQSRTGRYVGLGSLERLEFPRETERLSASAFCSVEFIAPADASTSQVEDLGARALIHGKPEMHFIEEIRTRDGEVRVEDGGDL